MTDQPDFEWIDLRNVIGGPVVMALAFWLPTLVHT